MEPVLIGYFPKRVAQRPDWLKAAGVIEICSASCCVSKDPDDWINKWLHNDLWVFPTEECARSVIPTTAAPGEFQIHAYRLFSVRFDDGMRESFAIPTLDVQPLPESYRRLGYDAVARSCGTTFECSPLSCNHGAEQFSVNEYCLLDESGRAIELAERFSRGSEGWEPGPYYVVEVLRCESNLHPVSFQADNE